MIISKLGIITDWEGLKMQKKGNLPMNPMRSPKKGIVQAMKVVRHT